MEGAAAPHVGGRKSGQDEFEPGADPRQWIEQHAGPYREQPIAVLRELLQNASDALAKWPGDLRFVEIGILSRVPQLEKESYHLVIRDSGSGMTEEQFRHEIGILGVSGKRGDASTIGEFGVGFYSTHAICVEVAVVSKSAANGEVTAWKYIPESKRFYRIQGPHLEKLLTSDFERHRVQTRRRDNGTSVYLNLDVKNYPQCDDWLQASYLAKEIKRDCILLPTKLFLADYVTDLNGAPIIDFQQRDIRDMSLSIEGVPWEVDGVERKGLTEEWFRSRLPYTAVSEHPKEDYSFHQAIQDGAISGFLYIFEGHGDLELFLKRMRVETTQDLKPPYLSKIHGFINLTPGPSKFNVKVLAARDHVLRDEAFHEVRLAAENTCIEFCVQLGKRLETDIGEAAATSTSGKGVCEPVQLVVNRSRFFEMLYGLQGGYDRLFMDITSVLHDIVAKPDCPVTIQDAVLQFVKNNTPKDAVGSTTLLPTLQAFQQRAEQEYMRSKSSGAREPLEWNPRVVRLFFERVGPFLPVQIHYKELLKGGGFQVRRVILPLCAIRTVDPSSSSSLKVLIKGRSEDYFSRNPSVRTVIVPGENSTILMLGLVQHLNEKEYPLEFISVTKSLFTDLATKEEWESLMELFRSIVPGQHSGASPEMQLGVDAMGYVSNFPPLLIRSDEGGKWLVINGYNDLSKEIRNIHSQALATNNKETLELIAGMCHELYHHAQPAELEGAGEELHHLETRRSLFLNMRKIAQKYHDLKR